MSAILPFHEENIPEVVDLYREAFQVGDQTSTETLVSYFLDKYFNSPWQEEELPSLIYRESGGEISGFLGVMPRRMRWRGESIRVAIAAQFMVLPDRRTSMAGVQLIREFLTGHQDLSLADGVGDAPARIFEAFGGRKVPLYSLYWSRPLSGIHGNGPPFLDSVEHNLRGKEASPELLLEYLTEFTARYELYPIYNLEKLTWLLSSAAQVKDRGPLIATHLVDEKNRAVGWYLYNDNLCGVGEVLQVGANEGRYLDLLDHLFKSAREKGVKELRGRLDPQHLQELGEQGCLFYRGPWTLIYSKFEDLLGTIHRGDAFLSRLDGEWCLRIPEMGTKIT